jgi:hypothetical protein
LLTAAQLKAARALVGMEQKALSQASGVSLPTIQRMEASNGTVRGVIEKSNEGHVSTKARLVPGAAAGCACADARCEPALPRWVAQEQAHAACTRTPSPERPLDGLYITIACCRRSVTGFPWNYQSKAFDSLR